MFSNNPDGKKFQGRLERLELTPGFISNVYEQQLIFDILASFAEFGSDSQKYPSGGGRSRVLRFGWSIDGVKKIIRPIPEWIDKLQPGYDSVVINEYLPGAFIGPHVDPATCANEVAIVSLASDCDMAFKRNHAVFALRIPRRSLLVMADNARYLWTHEIPNVQETRYSIVFRKRL